MDGTMYLYKCSNLLQVSKRNSLNLLNSVRWIDQDIKIYDSRDLWRGAKKLLIKVCKSPDFDKSIRQLLRLADPRGTRAACPILIRFHFHLHVQVGNG